MVVWWSGLYVCVADGFNFNQSGPALDGHEKLETASLCWKSLDMDGVLIYLFKTCEGGTFLVLSPLPGLHFTHDSYSICETSSSKRDHQQLLKWSQRHLYVEAHWLRETA